MPNRIIKESICVSEQIDELSLFEEIFFYRLLVNCDDYGCMDAREKVLAAKLFPLKTVKAADVLKALAKLAEVDLIGMYDVDGHPYLKVLKWSDHQRVRVSKHKYPEPTEEQLAASRGKSRQVAASCGELQKSAASCGNLRPESNPIQSNPNPYPNPNTNPNPIQKDTAKPVDLFPRFWSAYPRRTDKLNAKKQFDKINPDEELLEKMLSALEKQKKSEQWQSEGGKFIPYAATWLHGRRWEDEIQEKKAVQNPVPTKPVVAQQYTQRSYGDEQKDALMRMIAGARRDGIT